MTLLSTYFRRLLSLLPILLIALLSVPCFAADKKAPDVLVLSDGDVLHGTFVNEIGGTVTFHTDSLGDVKIPWAKIKELHTAGDFAVLSSQEKKHGRRAVAHLPEGPVDVTDGAVTVRSANQQPAPPVPVKDAQYIVDHATLDKQLYHEPSFFAGWNGSATAGATLVTATQNQYTVSGSLGLVRVVPTVSWLDTRNRTSTDFSGSFGKITQPGYTSPTGPVAATVTKTAITHFDAERDEYFSPRMFALGQTAFDHNFSQDLSLQQIYGGGIGWTVLKKPNEEADLKGTMQYEKQAFIAGSGSTNQNLIGTTIAATYAMKTKLVTWTQALAYIPAWNQPHDYSATETDTFAFPAYKNFSFSVGTLDSYLNDSPSTLPPTKHNSFQFTMGLTYALKSKY